MISEPTVLVLGAGASAPYGLPCSPDLKKRLIYMLDPQYGWHRALKSIGHSDAEIQSFREAFRHSSRPTIDAFLEHTPSQVELGKHCLALALSDMEIESALDPEEDDWYQLLFNAMASGVPFDSFGANRVSVVTFNYDRSLEQRLFRSLLNAYENVSEKRVADTLMKIPIVHVYGQLGLLPWQGDRARPYAPITAAAEVLLAAEGIRVISETPDAGAGFEAARKILADAQDGRVVFLGFGFDQDNFDRLQLKSTTHHAQYLACGYRIPLARQLKIGHWFPQMVSFGGRAEAQDWKCRQFLEEMDVF
jgi:hypothetical protein